VNGVESLSNDLSKADEAAMEGTMFLIVDHQQQVICLTLNLPQRQSSLFLAALATSQTLQGEQPSKHPREVLFGRIYTLGEVLSMLMGEGG
jgi:hypothetical protein